MMITRILATAWLATLCVPLMGQTHTHGSMAGYVRPTSAMIWTRASAAANVTVLYNSTPSATNAAETGPILVSASDDFTARITLLGLVPDQTYYFATRIADPSNAANNTIGRWGTFRTPPSKATPTKASFLVSGDVLELHDYGLFDEMQKHSAVFYLNIGDMPYADTAKDQAGYWERHRQTRDKPNWTSFIEKFPIEAIWDDHEIQNDWSKSTNPSLVAFGKKAFFDYFPFPPGTSEIYRTIRWGSGIEFFLLDARSHRDENSAPPLPTKTMLGAQQKAWLKSALLTSDATFKVICSQVPMRWGWTGTDNWNGFVHEREEILDFIVKNKIQNVCVLSGDSHLISVHNHREGIREYQCGPLAQASHPMIASSVEVRFRASVQNFLEVTVDPTVTPPTLTLEYFDKNNQSLYRDVVTAETPASGTVIPDLALGEYQLQGPHYYHNRGRVDIPSIAPGDYTVSFDPVVSIPTIPAEITLNIPSEAEVSVGARWRDVPGARTLFVDTFDQPLSGYSILDEIGATNGPSSWLTSGGELLQNSEIGGPVGGQDSDRPGTLLTTGDPNWTDYTVTVRATSHGHGRVGIVFRYQNENNYYRYFMDEGRAIRRLERKFNGVFATLDEQIIPYVPHNYYDIRCVAVGSRIKVIVDDQELFDVADSTFISGKVGFYIWNNNLTRFEDLSVTEGGSSTSVANEVFSDYFEDNLRQGWDLQDHATKSGASFWLDTIGVLMQLNDVGDVVVNDPIANPGTVCIATAAVPDDMQFTVSMLNYDDDGMGVVFRFQDAANHYRFAWNRELRQRQLQKVVNGTWSILWQDNNDYNLGQWYRVRVLAVGSRIRLYVEGELLADVQDTSLATGTVGMYSWRSSPLLFDQAVIQTPPEEVPVLAAVTVNRVSKIHGRAPNSANLSYGVALAFANSPGTPLAWLNAADPRVIELTPDRMFVASLYPSPFWTDFQGQLDPDGRMTATVNWPVLNGAKGIRMFAAGWTGDISRQPIQEVFPTVEIIYP